MSRGPTAAHGRACNGHSTNGQRSRDDDGAASAEQRARAAPACRAAPGARGRRRGAEPHPGRRPRRARPGLHPRDAAAAVAAVEPLLPRRGPRAGQHPRGGPGPAGRQPLRRQPDARHPRLHARLLRVLRRRAALLPAGPQPRAVDARAWACCASSAPSPRRPTTRARRWRRARRCSSTPAATTRSTARSGSATRSTSTGARASSALALEHDVPIVPVVVDRRPGDVAVPQPRRDASPSCCSSTSSSA